ncbi:MAG TPA: apolipoprotein N-acyltransferase, partial [Parafilimonas sp.]
MQKVVNNYKAMSFFSGILTIIAVDYVNFLPAWICFVPLFITLEKNPPKKNFKAGFIFGLTIALISFFWMMAGADRFTGTATIYGAVVYIISTALLAFYFGAVNWCFSLLKIKNTSSFSFLLNALLVSAIYVAGETLLMYASEGLPWFAFHSGSALMNNIYAIQPASFSGMNALSFIVVFVNYLIAISIVNKQWRKLFIPLSAIILYMLAGFFIYRDFTKTSASGNTIKPIKIAILNQNIPPEIKWDDNTGNELVDSLLALNKQAAALKPDIVLWSESAIPWTYRPDDDLVNEILKTSSPQHITNILGINTDYDGNEVYNSVYSLLPDGKVAGRYDKKYLLSFVEAPVAGIIFPFLSSKGFIVKKGSDNKPLNTPYGNAGIMICNESSVAASASDMVKNGAAFLLNLSNDGWFSNTYLVNLHFYNVRMRAVETRRDIVVNSNEGISGVIRASGQIAAEDK